MLTLNKNLDMQDSTVNHRHNVAEQTSITYSSWIFENTMLFWIATLFPTQTPANYHFIPLLWVWIAFHLAFFMVQLSHPYMTTGKTLGLTIWTFVSKVLSLLFNMLSRLVITFLPRSKRLLISWLQSPSAVILEPRKINSDTVSTVSPSISHEVMGPDAMIFVLWVLSFKPAYFTLLFNLHQEVLQFLFTFCH